MSGRPRILALSGGVGGAKLAAGLAQLLAEQLTVVVNTGDDFDHLGLRICPDIDSVCYALAGLNDRQRGWGRSDESWAFLEAVRQLGGPDWFQLGDRDLATHVLRTAGLRGGETLSEATGRIARALGIAAAVVPMSDDPVATIVCTDEGDLPFQEYFVARQCHPAIRGVRFEGAASARAARQLTGQGFDGIVICPSNPFVSVDPILSLPGVRQALNERSCPVVAVSPFVGGRALKGPAAKMSAELGLATDPAALAAHYAGLVDVLVVDRADVPAEWTGRMRVHATNIVMIESEDAVRLAEACLGLIHEIGGGHETHERE